MRAIALDYGLKRTGIATTDPMKTIASPLETVDTSNLIEVLHTMLDLEPFDTIVLGYPNQTSSHSSNIVDHILIFAKELRNTFAQVHIELLDERYTSSLALETMIQAGSKKKHRIKQQGNIDTISACIILQDYLNKI